MKLKKDNHLRINGEELATELGYKSTLDHEAGFSEKRKAQ